MNQRGQPDHPRSARYILKDFVNGKLLYCESPPDIAAENFNEFPEQGECSALIDEHHPQLKFIKVTSCMYYTNHLLSLSYDFSGTFDYNHLNCSVTEFFAISLS